MAPRGGIGPILPEHIVRVRMATEASRVEEESLDVGAIGPLLPGNEIVEELRHITTTGPSASTASDGQVTANDKLERESWMTDYLPVSTDPRAALKPRKFRQSAPASSGVDASWFTVSGSQATESVVQATANIPKPDPHCKLLQDVVAARDDKMMAVANEYNKKHKRNESLLERHQRKRAKELSKAKRKSKRHKSSSSSSSDDRKKHKHHKKHKKEEERKKEEVMTSLTRQPFDRDRDLFASRMDPLKRRAIIERSKNLGSRFAHGNQKFL
ncbi:hypothetical protein Aperf_G00000087412 [Anoplocephala perfoliata]